MTVLPADKLVRTLRRTLEDVGIDHEQVIDELGQVEASERRARGEAFSFRDHIRGLILALLSNQRPWRAIARNRGRIRKIFFDYEPVPILRSKPSHFVDELRRIRCGNRVIVLQMESLASNIRSLERIGREYGSLDNFVASAPPDDIARMLAKPGRHKLRQLGFTLAMEYLRNAGIRAGKPDLHIRRVLSGDRLGYFDGMPDEQQAYDEITTLAREARVNPTYLDNLLWMFCAKDYGNVCGAVPRCAVCRLARMCNFPT